jgi:hypothetical protein
MSIEFRPIGFVRTDAQELPRHWSVSEVKVNTPVAIQALCSNRAATRRGVCEGNCQRLLRSLVRWHS